jgi:carbon storage regulator
MLILGRRIGERIVIDGRIEVTVLGIRGGKVRLGFAAPRNVRILREEITSSSPARGAEAKDMSVEMVPSLTKHSSEFDQS